MKKITVIGKGLSGMMSVNFFNNIENWEVECVYNSLYPEQDVGISTALDFYGYMSEIKACFILYIPWIHFAMVLCISETLPLYGNNAAYTINSLYDNDTVCGNNGIW